MLCQLTPTCRPLPVTVHARLNTNARGRHGAVSFLQLNLLIKRKWQYVSTNVAYPHIAYFLPQFL